MIIRTPQVEAMHGAMEEEYAQQLIAYYRNRAPEFIKRFSDEQLKQKIEQAAAKAHGWGLNSAEGVMQYVGLALVAGPKFHEDPKVCALMSMPGFLPEWKVKRLAQLVHKKLTAAMEQTQSNG